MWILGLILTLAACLAAWRAPSAAKFPWAFGAVALALGMAAWTFFGGGERRPPAPPEHLVDGFLDGGRALGGAIAASLPAGGPILVLGRPSVLPPTYRQLHDRQMEGLRQALPAPAFELVPLDLAQEREISPLISRGETIGPEEIALFTARMPGASAVVVLDYGLAGAGGPAPQGPPVYVFSVGAPDKVQELVERRLARAGVVIPVGPESKGAAPVVVE